MQCTERSAVIEGQVATALARLLELLRAREYHFVTPTPATHQRVITRVDRQRAQSLVDILGWSLPFEPGLIDSEVLDLLKQSGSLVTQPDQLLRSRVRVSSLGGDLYLHSAYPTEGRDAVFFGPDSYRFAALIENELASRPLGSKGLVVDIGTGAGVGAVTAAKLTGCDHVIGTDINAHALELARINAAASGITLDTRLDGELNSIRQNVDLALANPPYIVDDRSRQYRDGGGMLGAEISLEMAKAALSRLAPGGRLILYTGSAISYGEDRLRAALDDVANRADAECRYRELDPDVFGEELERSEYRHVDRIALVAAILTRRA